MNFVRKKSFIIILLISSLVFIQSINVYSKTDNNNNQTLLPNAMVATRRMALYNI